jgi:hypothetical protein
MRIGLALDGLLADTAGHFNSWKTRLNDEADSYLLPRWQKLESFWTSLPPFPDVKAYGEMSEEAELVILTERSHTLRPITEAWVRNAGLNATVVFNTIKRYDCRIYSLDFFLDSDVRTLNEFVYDKTVPIFVNRYGGWMFSEEWRIKRMTYSRDLLNTWERINDHRFGPGWMLSKYRAEDSGENSGEISSTNQ